MNPIIAIDTETKKKTAGLTLPKRNLTLANTKHTEDKYHHTTVNRRQTGRQMSVYMFVQMHICLSTYSFRPHRRTAVVVAGACRGTDRARVTDTPGPATPTDTPTADDAVSGLLCRAAAAAVVAVVAVPADRLTDTPIDDVVVAAPVSGLLCRAVVVVVVAVVVLTDRPTDGCTVAVRGLLVLAAAAATAVAETGVSADILVREEA